MATVSTTGLVTGVAAGKSVITFKICGGSTKTATVMFVALPSAPAAIGGTKSVCVGSTTSLTNATSGGVWSSLTPAIATVTTAGVVRGVVVGTVTIRYTVTNASGCTNSASTTVTVTAPPAQPGNFTASTSAVTPGQSNVVYTVPKVSGVTYKWSYSGTGVTITGTTNSVLVSYSLTATSGTLGVTATNSCGTSIARTIAITILKAAIIPVFDVQGAVDIPTAKLDVTLAKNELKVYPNPTSGQVTFEFRISENAKVTLDITSIIGERISRIFDAVVEAEETKTVIFEKSLPPGVYLYYMRWNDRTITGKFIKTR